MALPNLQAGGPTPIRDTNICIAPTSKLRMRRTVLTWDPLKMGTHVNRPTINLMSQSTVQVAIYKQDLFQIIEERNKFL